jgi:uncharacterized protein (DUF433 family)
MTNGEPTPLVTKAACIIYSDVSEELWSHAMTEPELLTPAEAAVVASVSVRDINRMIDERILPERWYRSEGGRRVHVNACPFVGFYVRAAKALTAEERAFLINRLSDRIDTNAFRSSRGHWRKHSRPADWTIEDGFLTVSLWEFAASADDQHARLEEARVLVSEDPEILGGTPVIRGTRIPVHDVAASVAAGLSKDRIRAAYPGLDDRMIDLAVVYAEAAPPRGRPRSIATAMPDGAIVSERKVARRR